MSGLEIRSFERADMAAGAAARFVADTARGAMHEHGAFTLALSGGRTPESMFAALAREPLDWSRIQVFQVDERVAPPGDAARNLVALRAALLRPGCLPEANLHPMPVEDSDLPSGAALYAGTLCLATGSPPMLDLVHLGLGDDGHTASLVPGDGVLDETRSEVAVTGVYRGHPRMTLTLPALNRARVRLWLVTGADKGPVLARLRDADAEIPAGRVSQKGAVLFCDSAALTAMPA
jgi:6-phosphogluconolactonase